MVENVTALIDQSFVSNIKIVRFVLVYCSFYMNCNCFSSFKFQQNQFRPSKYQLHDRKKINCHLSLFQCRLTTRGNVLFFFLMVLYLLLPAKALCVIIKHKSISSFEICNSDSRVKQATAFSFYKAEATRSLDVH